MRRAVTIVLLGVPLTLGVLGARAIAQPAPDAPPPATPPLPPAQEATPPPQVPPTTTLVPPTITPPPPVSQSASQRRHAAELICAAHDPSCDWPATFSSLERRSIERVLAARGYVLDPTPWGKIIAHVDVVTEDVFAEKDWLQFFNIFHYRSRQSRVRQELTIQAGEVWDQARVEESARRLHDPLYSTVVALLPIVTDDPRYVDLLVVTRDLWSLRLNSQYTFQQASLTNLAVSLSENNFLGSRDVLSVGLTMDQGAIAVGPYFLDKDFLGKHLTLQVQANEILTREVAKMYDPATNTLVPVPGDPAGIEDAHTLHSEGENAALSLSLPLWALASQWGYGGTFSYSNSVVRSFTGVHGDPYELYTDPDSGLPYEYRFKTWSVGASAVRQWGTDFKHQLTVGYTVSSQAPSLLPSFSNALTSAAEQFEADVFPRDEVISEPYVTYAIFQPSYRVLRNIGTYELAEDVQYGPNASVTVAQGLSALGGSATFTRPTLAAAWTWPLGHDGYIHPSAGVSMRFQTGVEHGWDSIDNSGDGALRIVTPTWHSLRVVANGEVDTEWHNSQNQYFAIGSDSGLRGYNVNQFRSPNEEGARRVTGQVELRTVPVPWWVLRAGAVAFYEVGGAASSLADMPLYNDVGVGLRLLIPQLNRDVARIDVAFPLQATPNNPAFYPHFIAGFASYF